MLPRRYESEGVVLLRKNFSEADRILVVYSKHYGKLRLLAKGVRKPKSRKRGHIEVFSRLKFSASRGKGLDIVTEVEVLESFAKIRKDLRKASVAYFLIETVGRITRDEEKNDQLYSLLTDYLDLLVNSKNLKKLRQDFVYNTLVISGYWPAGKPMNNHDKLLEGIVERRMSSSRIGKKLLT
jgi:DNA repair protein RecO (recombination protein O)